MAVAIWTHRPSSRELLDCRLERGWRPTPTATVDGDVVLGYAACVSGGLEIPVARPSAAQGELAR